MTSEQRTQVIRDIKARIAEVGYPQRPLTDEEYREREIASKMGTIKSLAELGVKVKADSEGNIRKVIEVPRDYRPADPGKIEKSARQKRREKVIAGIEPEKMNVDLEGAMESLNPRTPKSEGAVIGKGSLIRKEWRKLHPPRWRPTKGRLQKSLAKAA